MAPLKISAKRRHESATLSGDRFPIDSKETARRALRLRGHTKTKSERRSVIRRAAKFLPKQAAAALAADKKAGLL